MENIFYSLNKPIVLVLFWTFFEHKQRTSNNFACPLIYLFINFGSVLSNFVCIFFIVTWIAKFKCGHHLRNLSTRFWLLSNLMSNAKLPSKEKCLFRKARISQEHPHPNICFKNKNILASAENYWFL